MASYRDVLTGSADDAFIASLVEQGILQPQTTPAYSGSNESGEFNIPASYGYSFIPGKATTPFGDPTNFRLYDQPSGQASGGFKLKNSNLIYNDPNFGLITPEWNTVDPSQQRSWLDMIGPIYMSLVMGGAGLAASAANAAPAAGELAGGLGAGAAGEVSGGIPIEAGFQTSVPWYAKLGLQAAKMVGAQAPTKAIPTAIPGLTAAPTAATTAVAPEPLPPLMTGGFDSTLYGDMSSVAAAPGDGSEYVAKASVPDAYNNSYNQVIG